MAIGNSISCPGIDPGNGQGQEGERCRQRRHQDGRESLACAAQHQLRTKRFAFFLLEVLEVIDHQDAVARRDPQHREKPHQRTERDDPAPDVYRQHPAHQGRGQQNERDGRQA